MEVAAFLFGFGTAMAVVALVLCSHVIRRLNEIREGLDEIQEGCEAMAEDCDQIIVTLNEAEKETGA